MSFEAACARFEYAGAREAHVFEVAVLVRRTPLTCKSDKTNTQAYAIREKSYRLFGFRSSGEDVICKY